MYVVLICYYINSFVVNSSLLAGPGLRLTYCAAIHLTFDLRGENGRTVHSCSGGNFTLISVFDLRFSVFEFEAFHDMG